MDPCLAIGYRLSRRCYGWGLIILIIVLIPAPAWSGGNKHNPENGFLKETRFLWQLSLITVWLWL
ncbi:hypothetical protein H6G48_01970 [Microcystis flos-aquae FACHB-1344]|uniref:Uncharacterized protein n=1 Tax=Microcystis flos-aquae FACHB-1344 TaxID=2692899 RepID=A0ABR8HNP4_9CHRO|nr:MULTISPECIES: hypothetical protein [Microcystis]MBD2620526.1 hypothetical protein [Microcystis flos-aquae FACHB-1344]MCA2699913.1 hypothetical protein [Microcystis sp. M179S2]